jgi:hypothetical protein
MVARLFCLMAVHDPIIVESHGALQHKCSTLMHAIFSFAKSSTKSG